MSRLNQPLVAPAPASAITIGNFIQLVKAEEAKWPASERTQTALMITRLRKIFYGTSGWDTYLIPGAKAIASGYNITEEETARENLSIPYSPDATIVRRRQVVKDASDVSPAIASQQEVKLEDGTFADIGHVFAGLDAANHPRSISAPLGLGLASASDNKAAVTWGGDIGSVEVEIIFDGFNRGVPTAAANMQAMVDLYASPQDMIGNIDAYVMADQYNITNSSGRRVSELLEAYYLSPATTPDGGAREHRYSRFCSLTGLTGWSGTAFTNESDWLNRWVPEVGGASALYIGIMTTGVLSGPARVGFILAAQSQPDPLARILLQNFLDELKARVTAEAP